jgi:glycosyltransferase involved in cell wall biosynthesis
MHRAFALRSVLRQTRPDVALSFMTTSNVLLALAASRMKGVATVGSERIHPPQYPLGMIWEGLRVLFYSHLDAIVAVSYESAEWLRRNAGAGRVHLIPNSATWPLQEQPPFLPPPVRSGKSRLLLAVGRFSQQKGFDLLILSFSRLAIEFPNWRLVILGDGPDRLTLAKQLELSGLNSRVALPGRVGNVGQWYAASDLYVMSSRFEGFPNTLVEAMAHGLAAVSFDCDTGPRDIIRHGVDGLLVQNGDIEALTSALRQLMGDDGLRQQYSAKAVEVREKFSLEKISSMWESLFMNLKKNNQKNKLLEKLRLKK